MAKITNFPSHENYGDWRDWASSHTDACQKNLGNLEEVPVGLIILFGGATVPTGYLECDGSNFDQKTYPALYNRLGATVLPNIPPVGVFNYAIRAR